MNQSHAEPRVGVQRGWTVVGNPAAGRGRGAQVLEATGEALRAAGVTPNIVASRDLDHARAEAAQAAARGDVAVAVGGDGLSGAMAGELAGTEGVLGIVPAGRGNDFVRALGLPLDAAQAAARLATSPVRRVDMGEVDGRPFVGVASVGIDADANRIANEGATWLGGAVYAISGIRALVAWRHAGFTVTVDGAKTRFRGFGLGIGSAGYYGAGLLVLPEAQVDDGLLHVISFGVDNRLRTLAQIPARRHGGHAKNPTIRFDRGTEVHVAADRPMEVYADGEPIGALPATIRIRPGVLNVLA